MQKLTDEYASELHEAVKLFVSQPLNFPLSRGQIMEVARIALPILEQQERGDDGWIEWGGGECPVADHVKVEYQLRAGAKGSEPAKRLEWRHEGKRHDIIAYRITPEQPTNQNGEQ
ncbi:hypothetical protein IFT95_03930 [Pantoea agglomerans]|uniref:hypothetical protein n=1 Tax=Enterobacter agglomerans TaxID=549 RepID=UPI00177D6E91|nr:hypothetical protein [Pantoea agglomerans]MBD8241344.1 hypothetical protein [Pantoea agglomerans]